MSRVIKFRAWDDKNKKWLLGYDYPNLGGFSLFGECVLMDEWSTVATSFMFEKEGKKISDLKLMQFTDLKDKNGKEIYEGDILKTRSGIGYMVFDNCGYAIKSPGSEAVDYEFSAFYLECEVIGNIHENYELIN